MISFLLFNAGFLNLLFYVFAIGFVISLIFFSWIICILVSKELDEHDHSSIVIDELAGYAIIYLLIPNNTI